MYKIKRIKFCKHSVLNDLELNFCDKEDRPVDTIILAGENGTGKSTIIDMLYRITSYSVDVPLNVEFDNDGTPFSIVYSQKEVLNSVVINVNDGRGMDTFIGSGIMQQKYKLNGLFSDVDINFHAKDVSTVTSLTLDETRKSRRSTGDISTQINQLLVDIQAIDDSNLAHAYREATSLGHETSNLVYEERMSRFTSAFNFMFEGLSYSRVENKDGKKSIIFTKNDIDIPISNLSSGEKQIVYRGCFLLKDVNATKGSFIFIDEPEISLHPNWQMKIMDYYKRIFTDKYGVQTSQIFAVTHSPFVIHNDNRRNDKVIILSRDNNGDIIVKDKPEYFKCNSIELVQDAFSIPNFLVDMPTVYLEGQTDEKYFTKALEIYGYSVPFKFKWIGYIDERGEERNTGKDALNKAAAFLRSKNYPIKNILLYDCDAKKDFDETNNVIIMTIPHHNNSKGISVGIENALVLDDIDIAPFKKQIKTTDGYGIEKCIPAFQKMDCCNYICNLDTKILENVFIHLQSVIKDILMHIK